ncbi:hypothetical protein [Roseibium sp.]|uniref:hypothetical protein n=1 Tax=Roseibium sp. TaxID=1936156 RepID=UPI0039EFC7EB
MKALRNWQFSERTATGFRLEVENRHSLQISVLENALLRVSLLKDGVYRLARTWAIAPEEDARNLTCPLRTIQSS